MDTNYGRLLGLAKEHGFESFTSLQHNAFSSAEFYDHSKDIFVIGKTSSGKTLVPLLLYQDTLRSAAKSKPKMLFVVPYRALAAQKLFEFENFFKKEKLDIVQSTGEFRADDERVIEASVDIAVIISEKAFRYSAQDVDFLSQYDYLVLDEIGLINDSVRGVRLDFILAWARLSKEKTGNPRVVSLGTPFYDWSEYVNKYGFFKVESDKRPAELFNTVVYYQNSNVIEIESDCKEDSTPLRKGHICKQSKIDKYKNRNEGDTVPADCTECTLDFPCRSDPTLNCPVTGLPCEKPIIISEFNTDRALLNSLLVICRHHLQKGHQILIFINDREQVKQRCADIYLNLREFFSKADEIDDPRSELLKECGLEDDPDDVYGILEDDRQDDRIRADLYRAFLGGVGFHSAALPNSLRTFVERNFLETNRMKIVCSTETLAFGVNSSVDVVIVADLKKNVDGTQKPLTLNEYANYAGRAGRLRTGCAMPRGYIYTFVRENERPLWSAIADEEKNPQIMFSNFGSECIVNMPFFILSLLPVTEHDSVTAKDLLGTVAMIPREPDPDKKASTGTDIEKSIRFLIENRLVAKATDESLYTLRGRDGSFRYFLTELGCRLRGYVISQNDFKTIVDALDVILKGLYATPDTFRFLWSLIGTNHAESSLKGIWRKSDTRLNNDEIKDYLIDNDEAAYASDWIEEITDGKRLSILAAIVAWSRGESPRTLYRCFGVHYSLLCKLTEQIAYLIEVTREIVGYRMDRLRSDKPDLYGNSGGKLYTDDEEFYNIKKEKEEYFYQLFVSVYYGINTKIANSLCEFIKEEGTEETLSVAEYLSLKNIAPDTARLLRRICVRYLFFKDPPIPEPEDRESLNNIKRQHELYKGNVKSLSGSATVNGFIYRFFKKEFPTVFTD